MSGRVKNITRFLDRPIPPDRTGSKNSNAGRKQFDCGTDEEVNMVILKLEQAFALGCTDSEACCYADISTSSFYDYQKRNPKFLENKNRLKKTPVLRARLSVVSSFKNRPEIALKYLERKCKDEFSVRQEYTGSDGGPIELTNVNQLTDDQLAERITSMQKRLALGPAGTG